MYDNRTHIFAIALIFLTASFPTNAQQYGQPIDESDVAPWDISIAPDGKGLPMGTGTAQVGAEIYEYNCASCHGETAKGGPAGSLVGGVGQLAQPGHEKTIGSYWPYSTTVFDYVRRAMPYWDPGSLTNDEVYALTAYLLFANGIISENYVLDASSLPSVQMPNRDGFISYWPSPPE